MKKILALFTIFLLFPVNSYAEDTPPGTSTGTNHQIATFAGGCFWCIQAAFDTLPGVTKTTVGYSGGEKEDANYNAVSSHTTKHRESINIEYDPSKVTFTKLLERFMRNIDPTDNEGQFADKGPQYRTAIFYHDEQQKKDAETYFAELKSSNKFKYPIYTEVIPFKNFYTAEENHQEYYKKNPIQYNAYKYGSGRPSTLKKIWGEEGGEH